MSNRKGPPIEGRVWCNKCKTKKKLKRFQGCGIEGCEVQALLDTIKENPEMATNVIQIKKNPPVVSQPIQVWGFTKLKGIRDDRIKTITIETSVEPRDQGQTWKGGSLFSDDSDFTGFC